MPRGRSVGAGAGRLMGAADVIREAVALPDWRPDSNLARQGSYPGRQRAESPTQALSSVPIAEPSTLHSDGAGQSAWPTQIGSRPAPSPAQSCRGWQLTVHSLGSRTSRQQVVPAGQSAGAAQPGASGFSQPRDSNSDGLMQSASAGAFL